MPVCSVGFKKKNDIENTQWHNVMRSLVMKMNKLNIFHTVHTISLSRMIIEDNLIKVENNLQYHMSKDITLLILPFSAFHWENKMCLRNTPSPITPTPTGVIWSDSIKVKVMQRVNILAICKSLTQRIRIQNREILPCTDQMLLARLEVCTHTNRRTDQEKNIFPS